jgi:threonine/homoserine/homoserine lactone efflux protein
MLEGLLVFAGTTLVLAMSPGPAFVLVMRQSLYGGQRIAVLSILGIASGLLAWMAAAYLGLTALITGSHDAYQAVRITGAVMLGVLGVRMLLAARGGRAERESRSLARDSREAAESGGKTPEPESAAAPKRPPRPRAAYLTGLLTCLTNPKVAIFAAALLPQFVSMGRWSGWVVAIYALTWAMMSSTWYVFLTFLMRRARRTYERPAVRRRLEQFSGCVLLAFALRLALQSAS